KELAISGVEENLVDILLEEVPLNSKIHVIKQLRTWTGFGLKESKDIIEAAPIFLNRAGVPREEAEEWKERLEAAGARVTLSERYLFRDEAARLVAQNPAAPAPLLSALARSADEATRRAVARNPGAPWPLL